MATEQEMKAALIIAKAALLDANRNGYTRGIEAIKTINAILLPIPVTPAVVYHSSAYNHHPVNAIEKL